MQKKVIYLLIFLLSGCSQLKESIGEFNEVVILTSNQDKNFIFSEISKLFSGYVNTPIEEPFYDIKWADAKDFKKYLNYKNVLLISLLEPIDSTIDLINSKFSKESDYNIFSVNDYYSKYQSLIFINADDSTSFRKIVNNNKNWILDEVDRNINSDIQRKVFYNGRNDSLQNVVRSTFGINTYIQNDYKLIKKTNDDRFLWIGRGYPYRWLMFAKFRNEESEKFDSHLDHFEYLLKNYLENVTISEYLKKTLYNTNGNVEYMRGLYEESFSDTGGPFFVKLIKLDTANSLYLSGFVNNPGKPKYHLLKELEYIIDNTNKNKE